MRRKDNKQARSFYFALYFVRSVSRAVGVGVGVSTYGG